MQVIIDKVTVPRENPRVSRPRLLRLLEEGVDSCTSTIIAGRAGTGKTLLATDFARRCAPRVVWYKVDASDGELRVFFSYLVETVSRQRPGFGQKVLAHIAASPGLEDIPTLAEAFLYELQECQDAPLLIVIDDLHLIYDAEWVVPFFRRLLPLLPPEAHVLLIGRSAPPTPMWRMRSKQTLCLIEEADLAFTSEEAVDLFASHGLGESEALAALEQTRGRASAIDKTASRMSRAEAGTHHVERIPSRRVALGSRAYPSNSQPRRGERRASGR